MRERRRERKEWERKQEKRSIFGEPFDTEAQANGLASPFDDPRHTEIRSALPESLQELFDVYIRSLLHLESGKDD